MLGCCILLSLVSQALTLEVPAEPASRLVPRLAQATGLRLQVASSVADDVLVLRLQEVEPHEALNRIAKVAEAEWIQEQPGSSDPDRRPILRLTRSSKIAQGQFERENAERVKRLKAETSRLVAQAAKQSFDLLEAQRYVEDLVNTPFNQIASLRHKAPGNRALVRLLDRMDPNLLASLYYGGRVVLSSAPNPMQRPLPEGWRAIVDDLVKEHGYYLTAAEMSGKERWEIQRVATWPSPARPPGDPSKGIGEVLVVLLGYVRQVAVYADVLVLDSEGKELVFGTTTIVAPPVELRSETTADDAELKLSPLALEYARATQIERPKAISASFFVANDDYPENLYLQWWPQRSHPFPISDELKALLRTPAERDPLSLAPSDALLQMAKRRNRSLVALLPDDVLEPVSTALAANPKESTFTAVVRDQLEIIDADGWIEVKPKMPASARYYHIDRPALEQLVGRVERLGYLGLQDLAEYAATNRRMLDSFDQTGASFASQYLMLVNPMALKEFASTGDWEFLRLLGMLSDAQEASLENGGAVAYGELSKDAREQARHLLFNTNIGVGYRDATTDHSYLHLMYGAPFERTERFPNGPTAAAHLRLSTQKQDAILAKNSQTGDSGPVTAADLAVMRFHAESPEFVTRLGAPPVFDGFRNGTLRKLTYRIDMGGGFYCETEFRTMDAKDSQWKPLSQLPQEFRSQSDRILAAVRKQYEQLRRGGGG